MPVIVMCKSDEILMKCKGATHRTRSNMDYVNMIRNKSILTIKIILQKCSLGDPLPKVLKIVLLC